MGVNIREELAGKKGEGLPLLKGSDVPKKVHTIKVKIGAVRAAPKDFTSILIIDFAEPIFEKGAWAVNKTNTKALEEKFGENTDKWVGKVFELEVATVNNPKSGKMTRSLFLEGITD